MGGPHPVWTVFSPETRTAAGTTLAGNVLSFLSQKGKQLFQRADKAVLILYVLFKLNFNYCVFYFRKLIQSVKDGDASLCPDAGESVHYATSLQPVNKQKTALNTVNSSLLELT